MRFGPFNFFEKKSLSNPTPEEFTLFGVSQPGLISREQAIGVPAVSAAVRVISEAVASLDISVVEIGKDGIETPVPQHPATSVLRFDSNEWCSAFELKRDLVSAALTEDKGGLAWVNRVENKPHEIIRYLPSAFSVAYDPATGEPSYKLNDRPVTRDDIIHLRGPLAQCPLTLAMGAATISFHLENHAKNLFKNGARPATVVRFKKSLGDDGLKRMKASWQSAFGGSEQGGRTAILWDDAEVSTLTLNSTDAQFLENRKFQNLEICRAFRVPPSMLFELDRATWSNGEQQGKEFLTYCLEPWLQALEAAFGRALFTAEERLRFKVRFDRDDLTRASLTDRATAINSLIASETINPNTGREWLGLSPYAGGETYGNRNITTEPKAKEAA